MTTEIKSGQTWADKNGDRLRVELVRPAHVEFKWEVGIMAILTTAEFLSAYDLVEDATPTPLDPSKVKAGDAVTLEASGGRRVVAPVSERTLPGYTTGTWFLDVYADDDRPQSFSAVHWTLTAHQPAPEPEPEWKPGTTGTATLNNRVTGNSAVGLRAMRTASREGVPGFALENGLSVSDDAVTYSVSDFVPDDDATWRRKYEEVEAALTELAPAPTGVCAHGQTAEDLCNAMPDKIELDAMWTAWKSLTPAEQRGWLEGGEGKVPTPAKVSIRTLMNGGAS